MDNNPAHLSIEAISRLKWIGIEETSLNELEDKQRMRIKALREMLEAEEQELTWIMAARSSSTAKAENHHGTVHAPVGYSDKKTWKDKIILAVAEAKRTCWQGRSAPCEELEKAKVLRERSEEYLEEHEYIK
jgi:hypothetical protein